MKPRERKRYERSIPRAGVDQETYRRVEQMAKQRRLYIADIVRLALWDYLNRDEMRVRKNPNTK